MINQGNYRGCSAVSGDSGVQGNIKIAFVSPFFGAHTTGGAETECRNTAIKLAKHGLDVHIITTTVQDLHHSWNEDYYPPGDSEEDGLTVHRFTTNKVTNSDPFGALNSRLIRPDKLTRAEDSQFIGKPADLFDTLRSRDIQPRERSPISTMP